MAAQRPPQEELDQMSPDQRLAAFRDRVITDPDVVPADVLDRFHAKARRLAAEID